MTGKKFQPFAVYLNNLSAAFCKVSYIFTCSDNLLKLSQLDIVI